MKTTSFTLILFTLLFASFCKGDNSDSLYTVWQDQTLNDSVRVKAFNKYISREFLYSRPDTAFTLAGQLIAFSIDKNYEKGHASGLKIQGASWLLRGNYTEALNAFESALLIMETLGDEYEVAACLNNLGITYKNKGDYPEALKCYSRASKLFEKIENPQGQAASLSNVGVIHQYQGNYPKALDYYERARVTYEKTGNKKGIVLTLNNVGLIYKGQGEYAKALDYFEQSRAIQEDLNDEKGIGLSLNNIGLIHDVLGENQQALEYFQRSLSIREKINDQKGIAASLGNIGTIEKKLGNYSEALDFFERALFILEEIGDQQGIITSLTNMGTLNQVLGKTQKAKNYCEISLEMSEQIGLLREQKTACDCLYDIYKNMGDGRSALTYLEKANILDDSLKARETSKKLQQIEFEKKMLQDSIAQAEEARMIEIAHQEEVRKKNQTRNVLVGSSFLLLLLAGGLYSRWRYVRKSRDVISKEKDRSDNLLLNILPAEIAEELKEKGRADARNFDMVSILFTDFKGFTEASARLSAEDLVAEINECFQAFDAIMGKYDIEKIKTIGDAYMAAGGLPVPIDDSVKNTVLAALEMQKFIGKRRAENESKGMPSFEMRVGIHTGPVVAGIVGVKKFQYDIWGDTVNTASRMESCGEVGSVNISQATYELLKDETEFKFESRGKIEAKGKGEIEMYFVSTI